MMPKTRDAEDDDAPEMPDRMIEHDGDGLKILDEGEGEPFDLSESATEDQGED